MAPARKEDPGELFPWKALAEYGIGLWPQAGVQTAPQDALRQYGYGLPPDVEWLAKDAVVRKGTVDALADKGLGVAVGNAHLVLGAL